MLYLVAAGLGFLCVAILLCDLLPPPSPGNTPGSWVQFWSANIDLKRLGVILGLLGGSAFPLLVVVMFLQLKRIDGPSAPLAYLQLGAGLVTGFPALIFPWIAWSPLVFRGSTLNPDVAQALTDIGMFSFFLPWPGLVQIFAVGFCVLRDREQKFPRWYGYLSFWVAVSLIPGGILYFFKSGPMAWNGLLPWWVGVSAVVIWVVASLFVLFRAIAAMEREETAHATESLSPR